MRRFLGSACILLAVSSALAQSRVQIQGVVRDPSGAVVPGTQITLAAQTRESLGKTSSDAGGQYRLSSNFSIRLKLTASHDGFRSVTRTLNVAAGATRTVDITLPISEVTASIDVQAEGNDQVSTETDQNRSAQVFDRDLLNQIPVFDNDILATLARFLNSDATGTNGVSLVVNGIEAHGPGVPPSAIKSVKINQNPYSALFSRPGRARLELTTEGGTPQLHGSFTGLLRNSAVDARNYFATVKPPERRLYAEGSLTGPLSRNARRTFLLGFEVDRDDRQTFVFAATPGGVVSANVPLPQRHVFLSARGFQNYSQANQIWIGYSYENRSADNVGVGGTVLASAGTNTRVFENEINVQDTHVLSKNAVNALHFLVGQNANGTASTDPSAQIAVSGSFTGGGAQADLRRTENHFDGTDIVTYTRGKHQLKFGVDVPDISRRAYNNSVNRQGTYSFASLSDYVANKPFSFLQQTGQSRVVFWEKTVAGIVEDTVRLTPRLTVVGGLRYYWQNFFHDVAHNFAPRFDVAFAPSRKSPSTVLRAGAGVFFDRSGSQSISDLLLFDGNHLQRRLVLDPSFPATNAQVASTPISLVTLDPAAIIPFTVQFSAGAERQLGRSSTASVNYVGYRSYHLFRSVDANAPRPPAFNIRPNASFGQIRQIQSEGSADSNALEITFRGKPVSWFSGQAQYALTKSYNNTAGILYFPAYSYAPGLDWSRSDNDRRHKFDMLGTAKVRTWFRVGTALSLYSGLPVNITTGNDDNNEGLALDRPVGVPRNSLHGPGYFNLDLSLSREFVLKPSPKDAPTLAITLNSFNVTNHTNATTYIGVVSSPFFRTAVSSFPARRLQMNVQFRF